MVYLLKMEIQTQPEQSTNPRRESAPHVASLRARDVKAQRNAFVMWETTSCVKTYNVSKTSLYYLIGKTSFALTKDIAEK